MLSLLFVGISELTNVLRNDVSAASCSWIGGNGAWETGSNWSTGVSPTAADDVIIDATVTVTINAPTTVNSVTLGNISSTTSPVLIFGYDGATQGPLTTSGDDFIVYQGATITHSAGANDSIIGRVNISALSGNVEIYGSVNVDAKGYSGGTTAHYYGWGPGGGSGQSHSYQDRPGAGGGHGGWGGKGWSSGGAPYESHLLPLDVGSGGGRGERYGGTTSNGGAGGGAVKITASGSIIVNGSITSSGGSGLTKGGGGSGGSIHLVTSTLAGTGTISALGGNGGSGNGGLGGNGGGGRILIEFTLSDSYTGTNSVNQGLNGNSGEHGSSLLWNSTTDDLWIKTSQTWNGKPSLDGTHHTYRNVYIENSSTLMVRPYIDTSTHNGADNSNVLTSTTSSWENDYWVGTVIYNDTDKSKGTVTSNTATTITAILSGGTDNDWDVGDVYVLGMGIKFSVNNFVLETGSAINSVGKGYAGGTTAHYYGWGPGGGPGQTHSYGDRPGAGGGYGGKGGNGYSTGGSPYGSQYDPIDLGSGGGRGERYNNTSANGGPGGGSLHIVASDSATIDGTIDVSGGASGGYKGGGGSGGSIKVEAQKILGTGVMTANGGSVSTTGDSGIIGGTGGGGRITLLFSESNSYTGTTSADPGPGGTLGDPGTIELVGIPSGSSLAQYKSDGTTLIPTGNPTDETTVVLKMTMSDIDATDTLTSEFEVKEVGTDFTGTATHTGSGVAYSGTPVEGSVTVSGLSDYLHYHWQARVCDSFSVCTAWISYGGNQESEDDFYVVLVHTYNPTTSAVNINGNLDIYAGRSYDVTAIYSDTDGPLNLTQMYLRIDHPTEIDIEYYALGGNDASGLTPTAISGADRVSAITYDRDASNPTANDVTITWHIKIDWQWVESSLIEYGVRAVDDEANDSGWDFTNRDYLYENDLTFTGTLTATGAVNGPLISGDWVQASEAITWSGVTAVYEGTTTIYLSDDDFDVRVADDDGGTWDDIESSGVPISIVSVADAVTDTEDIHTVYFMNLPVGAGDASNEAFTIRVDDSTPDIVDITGANEGVWQSSDAGPILSWTDPSSPSDDTFYLTNDGTDPTSSNFTYSTTSATYDLPDQGEGTTTIKARAVNGASTAGPIYSFSVMYNATNPVIDTLTSSSHPSEVTWYSDNTPTVEWTTSDGASGVEGTWRLLDQTAVHDATYVITNGTADIEDGTWTSGVVADGMWYFHLAVRDNTGLTSYGTRTILVDTGAPTIDTLTSSSHPIESNWYPDDTPSFEWTTSDGASGVEGTWRLLDQTAVHDAAYVITNGTADIEDWNWTSTAEANGIWYFHLAVRDNTGLTDNSSYTVQIDNTTPDIVDITGANDGVWQSSDGGPVLSWTDPSSPSDDTFYLTNDGMDPTPINFTYSTSNPTYDLPDQGEGTTTIKVRAVNGASTAGPIYSFSVMYDAMNPAIDTLTSSSHPSEVTWYSNNLATVEWTTSDGLSGVEGTWRLLDQTATHDAAYVISNGTADIEDGTWTSGVVADGTWYFHLAVRDNTGLTSYGIRTILIDTGAPTIDTLTSLSHQIESNWYPDDTPSFEWTTSDEIGGVEGTWRLLDQTEIHDATYIITNGTADIEDNNWTSTAVANGTWYFHLAVRDNTGLTDNSSYTIWIDSTTPDIVDITGANEGVWQNTDPDPILSWTDPSSPSDDTFYLTNDGTDPTSSNFTYSTTDPTYDLPDQGEGETEIRVRAMNGAGTYSTTLSFLVRYDSVPPANVSGLTVTALSTSSLQLNWTNPADADFDHVVVVRKTGSYPTNPGDDTLVYTGSAETYTDNGLSASTKYYYAVFSFDTLGNQSSGAVAFGTTLTPVIPEEPVTPTTPTTSPTSDDTQDPVIPDDDHDEALADILDDIDNVEVVEIEEKPKIIILVDGKEIDLSSVGTVFHVYTGSRVDIQIPYALLVKDGAEIRETLVMVGNNVYLLTKNEINGEIFYTAVFDIAGPTRKLEIDIVVTYEDNTAKTTPLTLEIDPYGYVYTFVDGNQMRIKGANVTLITRTDTGEGVWKSDDRNYPNPQQTDAEGEYAFFVEAGEYQVRVTAEGYNPAHTEWFTVEDGPLDRNIELKKKKSVTLITAIAVGGATATFGVIIATKKTILLRKGNKN